ncbi:MAG: hypothetical protein Q9M92_02615, partial [Enterobacterales bacterium]|nr:hypothetical protein [Enterobacterales bacterium]
IVLNFDQPGDQLGLLRFKVKSKLGQGQLKFIATNGEHESVQEIYIDVRSANPKTYRQTNKILAAGEKWNTEYQPHGLPSTNSAVLEFSRVPPLNLESRLDYLIHYPHGCVEQTTSAVFPQLFLSDLVNLENDQADQVENNVANGIEKLRSFQLTSGGFSYWPGQSQPHIWATNYVGEFLLAAKSKGYDVPSSMLAAWTQFQQSAAASWTAGNDLVQSYRLYLLALAGEPAIGAMNRLRENDSINSISRWYLAAAYQKIGQSDAAKALVANLSLDTVSYKQIGINLDSQLRDQAIMLQSLLLLDDKTRSDKLVKKISARLSSGQWLGTQETAMALHAMNQYITGSETSVQQQNKIKVAYKLGEQSMQLVTSNKPIWKSPIKVNEERSQAILINNQSGGDLYVTLHSEGIPKPGGEKAEQQGLAIEVSYLSKEGYAKDVSRLTQGTDMTVKVMVRNDTDRDFKYLALTQILPSGWEIHHQAEDTEGSINPLEYQDIRDDRVLTYFGLEKHQEKEFVVTINATYLGKFYLPAFKVEAMYDASKYARSKGQWVEVIQQN